MTDRVRAPVRGHLPTVTVWHNPRCSKSRTAVELLRAKAKVEIRRYLEDAPTADELRALLAQLGRPAIDLARHKDAAFHAAGLSRDSAQEALIAAMAANPALIERPIALYNGRAVIGRPPEDCLSLLP
ncbi:MAG TPA: arsenate reductase (glutaredoxin) [Rhodobacteraceae bacterium]|jgi:arsenate reductase|nr:arsenate reductase (glutaredoxin) [Paracoccaceae bacterium]HBV55165.1 arsenate reductase (glutaredoxin) [Paracoccaceae bacterium]